MSTLDEIKWFCKEKNSVGALLFTGEWGCGKTYFINNYLPKCNEITSEYIIVKVSLFGATSTQSVEKKVKLQTLACRASKKSNIGKESKKFSKLMIIPKIGKALSRVAQAFHPAGKAADSVFAIDWLDFINIPEKIDGKQLLLIFDDLERTTINTKDLIGCLNEYIEIFGIKTIIIANEEKIIKKNVDKEEVTTEENIAENLSYSTFKEKIISRTVKYNPNYDRIVEEIVESFDANTSEYKSFLNNNISITKRVFRDSKTNNIRSLKCAIQDFERVFDCLIQFDINDDSKIRFFSTFLVLDIENKTTPIEKTKYDYLLVDSSFGKKYVDFRSNYVIEACRKWIASGEWNQANVISEIDIFTAKLKSLAPEDIFLRSNLIELEDAVFTTGSPIVLEKAYNSMLSMDEYLGLLRKFIEGRVFDIRFPIEIDFGRLRNGLNERISRIKKGDVDEPRVGTFLLEEQVEQLTEREKQIYKIIEDFREYEQYYKNRLFFLNAYQNFDEIAIVDSHKKYYKSFDIEMAMTIIDYYKKLNNGTKRYFCSEFLKSWRSVRHKSQDDLRESIKGIQTLIKCVEESSSNGNIAGALDRTFVKNLKDISDEYIQTLSTIK